MHQLDLAAKKNLASWLEGTYSEETKQAIITQLRENPQEIENAFSTHLKFGTGGLRGLIGIGPNRMNVYTIRAAAQGLANFISAQTYPDNKDGIFIGYDTRLMSREFAEEAAKVFAGNSLKTYLSQEFCATPMVSYAVRRKKCMAGVMITASHNPSKYNGFKVYGSDGGQVLFPQDQEILAEILKISDPRQVKIAQSLSHALIEHVGNKVTSAYLKELDSLQSYFQDNQEKGNQIKIVYTSLHGVGMTIVPKALNQWGFQQIEYVKNQIIPDGLFPTVESPNPESREALQLGINELLAHNADLLIATDPDADRMGIAIRHQGQVIVLNGHQLAVLILEFICQALTEKGRWPKNAVFVKTLGTTEMFRAICEDYQGTCFSVLNGFKYVAEKIREWEESAPEYTFVFACEESLGFLYGSQVRDKDAVLSSCLISEMVLQAKLKNKTLLDKLYELYAKYGIYREKSKSLQFSESIEGRTGIEICMESLRQSQLKELAGIPISIVEDYSILIRFHLKNEVQEPITQPPATMLVFWLEDGSRVIVRPSGTEPKIKLSCSVVKRNFIEIAQGIQDCTAKCDNLLNALCNELNTIYQKLPHI